MKPRPKPLVLPDPLTSRYWTVDLTEKGPHTFKHPYYGVGLAIVEAFRKHAPREPDERTDTQKQLDMLPAAGMMIGSSWSHRLHELETPLPLNKLDPDSLTAYGNAVVEELQDAGYDMLDIMEMFGKIGPEFQKRQSLIAMAESRSAFSAPPEGASTH